MARQPYKVKASKANLTPAKGKGRAKAKTKTATNVKKDTNKLTLDMKSLRKLVRSGTSNDATAKEMTRAFLGVALEAVKTAEDAYEKSPHAHNSYALNGLMNQARELAADLRQLETIDENRKQQVADAVHAVMRNLAFQTAQHINSIKLSADNVPAKFRKNIDQSVQHSGRSMSRLVADLTESLINELTKDL